MKLYQIKNTFFVILFALTTATACGGMDVLDIPNIQAEGNEESNEDTGSTEGSQVAGFSTNDQYLFVPASGWYLNPDDYPGMSILQEMARGSIKMFNPELHFPINWEDEASIPPLLSFEELESYMEENDQPNEYGCALPLDPTQTSVFTTDGAGTNAVPERDESWAGSQSGGCGTWATAMCNRILGLTDANSEVSKDEWNGIAGDLSQDGSGGSKMTDQSKYYEDRGYAVHDKKFSGSAADYSEMIEKINDRCDVKLFFWKRNADGTYTNGHVETVTGATGNSATTNSWGQEGVVQGGNDGGFDHSLDGTQFQDSEGNELWPEGATEVWVSYVCEPGFFEGLAQALGF